jgi:hypothetical protein
MVYLITYDLRQPGRNYADLFVAIKNISGLWAHPLESVWLVDTNLSANDISNQLKPRLDGNDLIFITALGRDYQGILLPVFWDWLRNRVYA